MPTDSSANHDGCNTLAKSHTSKIEAQKPKSEIRMTASKSLTPTALFRSFAFRISCLFQISIFGFPIADASRNRLPSRCLLFLVLAVTPVAAQFEDDESRPGLIGHYRGDDERTFKRVDSRIAFAWGEQTPDRRLPGKDFEVDWSGYLMSQTPGKYRLSAWVDGDLRIELAGKVVLEARAEEAGWFESDVLDLPFDFHPFTVRYRKTSRRARLVLYWSGPQFQLEPIGGRYLSHDSPETPDLKLERGMHLVRALRCVACHEIPSEPEVLAGPSLAHLEGTLRYEWLVQRLQSDSQESADSAEATVADRKMPHFSLSAGDSRAIADYLFAKSDRTEWIPPKPAPTGTKPRRNRGLQKEIDPVEAGEHLLLTSGCLACHSLGGVHTQSEFFGGGDLAKIAAKRPPSFFERWLASPESINEDHRMPVFSLSDAQRRHLAAFLVTLGQAPASDRGASSDLELGKVLIERMRCSGCHRLPNGSVASRPPADLRRDQRGCLDDPIRERDQPGFRLNSEDREAIQSFLRMAWTLPKTDNRLLSAEELIAEHNCLACHTRDGVGGIAGTLSQLTTVHEELAPLIPAMIPPALDQVGDKLHRGALDAAIRREGKVHRDYLAVQMPQFRMTAEDQSRIVDYLIAVDRIPAAAQTRPRAPLAADPFTLNAAGGRLVTSDGFGCTSCHQIGSVRPIAAPLNTRGPNVAMFGKRIRREWFDRFVNNPARVIPGMEMPSVRLAVRGVLDDDLDKQLSAVWDVLNQPGFEPPLPNPVRILRHSGTQPSDRALAITDVLRVSDSVYLKPLLIGLSNRHNILIDLETARMAWWSVGDTARQRTEGKTWYWEAAGNPVLAPQIQGTDVALSIGGAPLELVKQGQFATEIDTLTHESEGISIQHRLHFRGEETTPVSLLVKQTFRPLRRPGASGFHRTIEIVGAPAQSKLRLQVASSAQAQDSRTTEQGQVLQIKDALDLRLVNPQSVRWDNDGSLSVAAASDGKPTTVTIEYWTSLPVDHFPTLPLVSVDPEPVALEVVPGFEAVRLPFSAELMPTGLAWRPNGDLLIASLKGRVWIARDSDGDGLEDQLRPFSDELAAPYGLAAADDYVDVITKFALLRLYDDDDDGQVDRTVAVASGWGHTTDYHDWAVGLPRDAAGNYYVAIPCQQDERSEAAAHLRGTVLRLVPQQPTKTDPRAYSLEQLTAGHRFPMGLALRKDGELFVTDNQGNYNPFNELNHVVPNRRFGFINTLERRPGFNPPLTPPAIDIPHPWTRSVNGICFLETPGGRDGAPPMFGPFEGHLIGCELDTSRLVRMTLEKVGGEFQGAAYPFSYDQPKEGSPFLGPLECAVAPDGDIYVGGVRDSGWGGGNNTGEIVRLRPQLEEIPCGISEVRATPTGFRIHFTSPVDRKAASDPANYGVSSYTRVSTPVYGGDDEQRRNQPVKAASVAADGRSVTIDLPSLLAGHVYEIHVRSLTGEGEEFFPAEAHYTLRRVPGAASLQSERNSKE